MREYIGSFFWRFFMPFVQDFIVIPTGTGQGGFSRSARVGDSSPGFPEVNTNVTINDIRTDQFSVLHFEVRGLTVANENPRIEVNGNFVGRISRYAMGSKGSDGESRFWMHQSLVIAGNRFRRGNNTITIRPAGWADSNSNDRFDDFDIRNMVLFYKTNIGATQLT
ncbi:hypothetical protein SLH49_09140 [Cognatiyoonia sp. IB215446]|uniref:hypothetical protein n=1 Tax=Cognatiyoonia sp. IB215446 TaxID=3097355 RepID=UPI002A0F478F|nr:hypothetical protein [Cognatiyoonia sp. IB215446]MDX8348150.1 hypothetical protein [Cognatiyoonia sp. IB215446]